ncbi:hypothetical protein [Brevibacillus sp. NRS-1366]|uniref:hypothetical protein n=1 Tax=Brevibacillus sp. NRS-1366 TaxID=3233899 RepID=UPI003D1B5E3D
MKYYNTMYWDSYTKSGTTQYFLKITKVYGKWEFLDSTVQITNKDILAVQEGQGYTSGKHVYYNQIIANDVSSSYTTAYAPSTWEAVARATSVGQISSKVSSDIKRGTETWSGYCSLTEVPGYQ